jgi:UDP-3-O-[3-hydroxymyristoyl] glucosamine N-acyltransferase
MNNKVAFLDRLRYGKHQFMNGVEVYGYPHVNPDGSTGGWVAETALVDKTCYIAPTAEVYEYAQVHDGATIKGESEIRGFAQVRGAATVDGASIITDEALVEGDAFIDSTSLGGRSHVDCGIVNDGEYFDYLVQVKASKVTVRRK